MGKKKEKVKKPKKYASGVEERLKKISSIQSPDANDFKMENEERIGKFLRFGMMKIPSKEAIKKEIRNKK